MPEEQNMADREVGLPKIKVIGVGGGGCNAVNNMIDAGIKDVSFVTVNTDLQSLLLSKAEKKIQIGKGTTKGLGAGADPNVGKEAAKESSDELRRELDDVDLLFLTAGMGGGTGTGALPIIANMAKEKTILTIAVVTTPFPFEGSRRMRFAMQGIEELRSSVDTLLIVPNAKLLQVLPPETSMVQAFANADNVLRQAVQGIADLITKPLYINVDFADIRTTLKEKGIAHIGMGFAQEDESLPKGSQNKVVQAIKEAVNSPLLDTDITGATNVILNIVGGMDMTMHEVDEGSATVYDLIDANEGNVIIGMGYDERLNRKVEVTLIATGFKNDGAGARSAREKQNAAAAEKSAPIGRFSDAFRKYGPGESAADGQSQPNNYPSGSYGDYISRQNVGRYSGQSDNGYSRQSDASYPRQGDQGYSRDRAPQDDPYRQTDRYGRGYPQSGGYSGERQIYDRPNAYEREEEKPEEKSGVKIPPFMRMLRNKKQ